MIANYFLIGCFMLVRTLAIPAWFQEAFVLEVKINLCRCDQNDLCFKTKEWNLFKHAVELYSCSLTSQIVCRFR